MIKRGKASFASSFVSVVLVTFSFGCTSISVRPVEARSGMGHVCIKHNSAVEVSDFVAVVRDGLARHGVSSEEFFDNAPLHCEFILRYTARRSWDLAPYLSQAEIWIERDGAQVGYAEFHLRGKGGYSFYKWQGTKEKMDPVIDQLFAVE
jgi:hypothetical protein